MEDLPSQSPVDCNVNGEVIRLKRSSPNLSLARRESIYFTLEAMVKNGDLPHGSKQQVATMFRVSNPTVARIWCRGRESLINSHTGVVDVSSIKNRSGRRPTFDRALLKEKLKSLPLRSRRTSRDSAAALGISQGLFLYLIKKYKIFRAATLAAKATLTEKHRTTRVSFLKEQFCTNSPSYFDPQFQTIHIDEKWFQKKETRLRAYLADDEAAVAETVQHKAHIEKVMFLAAVARPRRFRQRRGSEQVGVDVIDGELVTNLFGCNNAGITDIVDDDNNSSWYFEGKVGLYPVVEETLAKRNSVNRKKGTVVLQAVSMTKEVYVDFVLNKLLPDIVRNCPPDMRRFPIYIQHDNAPPHKIDKEIFKLRCSELGIDCQMFYQPAQSPDMNICDLSFIPAIQSL
jgi:hypothetical protein